MFNRIKLGTKIISGFMAVSLIALILGVSGYYGADKNDLAIREIGDNRLPSIVSLQSVSKAQVAIAGAENALLSTRMNATAIEKQYQTIVKFKKLADEAWKVYVPLPQTDEESTTWKQFVPAWEKWWKDHETYMQLSKNFSDLGIPNPTSLQREFQRFMKDHARLQINTLLLAEKSSAFEGGEDPTQCNLGKWLTKSAPDYPQLKALIDVIIEDHNDFHADVKEAKQLVAKGDNAAAAELIQDSLNGHAQKSISNIENILAEATKANELLDQKTLQATVANAKSFYAAQGLLDKLIQINEDAVGDTVQKSQSFGGFMRKFSMIALILGVAMAVILGLVISRSITRPIQKIISALYDSSAEVTSATGQVSVAAQSLAEGASEQAASIEETSSSMEEMSAMTKQNAEHANQADLLMKETRQIVEKSNASMAELTTSMMEISKASTETAKIIKTIDEIAFQTNLLALNAAVEAARAGEAGAGFAVVADEVRNLAMRAAEAAKNTADLIEDTAKRVKDGSAIVAKTNEAFAGVAGSTVKVGELIGEIAAASNEQSRGIEQVNRAVTEMDKVIQQNASQAEETASASEEISAQAEQLKSIVNNLTEMVRGHQNGYNGFSTTSKPDYRALHETAQKKFTAPAANSKSKGVKPHAVIPFDGDDFGDF